MITPPFLKQGDKIAIVAPAGKLEGRNIDFAIQALQNWGFEVILGKNLFKSHFQFAGTDQERLADLQEALDNPEIKAIICARGGYGMVRIIDQINFAIFQKNPKWVVGFSDITTLLTKVNALGVESIHATMPTLFETNTQEALISLKKLLLGESFCINAPNHALNRLGNVQGALIGGNLCLLHNQLGTSSDIDFTEKILFIEDIDEYLYNIDRMMWHLKRAGKLANLAGLIVGQFSKCKDNESPFGQNANEIIAEVVKDYAYPVCYNFPIGHEPHNMAVACGRIITLSIKKEAVILDISKN